MHTWLRPACVTVALVATGLFASFTMKHEPDNPFRQIHENRIRNR